MENVLGLDRARGVHTKWEERTWNLIQGPCQAISITASHLPVVGQGLVEGGILLVSHVLCQTSHMDALLTGATLVSFHHEVEGFYHSRCINRTIVLRNSGLLIHKTSLSVCILPATSLRLSHPQRLVPWFVYAFVKIHPAHAYMMPKPTAVHLQLSILLSCSHSCETSLTFLCGSTLLGLSHILTYWYPVVTVLFIMSIYRSLAASILRHMEGPFNFALFQKVGIYVIRADFLWITVVMRPINCSNDM